MTQVKNPRGAGRHKNTWESRQMLIPDPIMEDVAAMVERFKKQQKASRNKS